MKQRSFSSRDYAHKKKRAKQSVFPGAMANDIGPPAIYLQFAAKSPHFVISTRIMLFGLKMVGAGHSIAQYPSIYLLNLLGFSRPCEFFKCTSSCI